jgi:hypothetical protein
VRYKVFLAAILTIGVALSILAFFGVPTSQVLSTNSMSKPQGYEDGWSYWVPIPKTRGIWKIPRDMPESPFASELQLQENGVTIGPPHSEHELIRAYGEGRYSHWGGGLYFSASDNTDPRSNGRIYEATYSKYLPQWAGALGLAITAFSLVGMLSGTLRRFWASRRFEIVQASIGMAIIAVFAAAGEIYFRQTTPFTTTSLNIRFDPEIGFTYEPGSLGQWTNQLDFWTIQQANSLGFFDRPPPTAAERESGCNVAFIGDSFVEALQVPIKDKFHVRFEQLAKDAGINVTTSAFGYSGTGQLNQIPFYQKFARQNSPDYVVLVLVSNDVANNSRVLEAVRNGWHPGKLPRMFANRIDANKFELLDIDPDWKRYILDNGNAGKNLPPLNSLFARWLGLKVQALLGGTGHQEELIKTRLAQMAELDGEYVAQFDGWVPTSMGDLDAAALLSTPPGVVAEGYAFTAYALQEFKTVVERDGASLVILSTHSMRPPLVENERLFERLSAFAAELDIPVIDQTGYIESIGEDPKDANFQNDGHWNKQGHMWAAEALMDFFEDRLDECQR